MVHDAQVAVTLLNRWERSAGRDIDAAALLREGGLKFHGEHGALSCSDAMSRAPAEFQCFAFDDGSRALRLIDPQTGRGLTAWTALAAPGESSGHRDGDALAEGEAWRSTV